MRIALVSDIHGNLAALEAVVADIRRRGVDRTVNLGDSLSGPLLPRETAQFLMAQDWVQLAGNHERYVLGGGTLPREPSDAYAHAMLGATELDWLRTLTHRHALTDDDAFLCHATPARDDEYFFETVAPHGLRGATADEVEARLGDVRAALVACGHTHTPRLLRSRRGQLLLNPGSVGQPAYDDEQPFHHAVENGAPDARYAIAERGTQGRWSAELIAVPYDHATMAALARERGRLEWEHALLWGRMP
ncbi:metallophosphoesterase family protein [Methylibium sp.]|uniref:metallophosphoesterase family protein n=1 Tax=Methylibium sp. TaxID=2067992 RepID=UPI003D119FED